MSTYRPMGARADRPVRLPEQGRIRLGRQVPTKSGKMRPDKLHTFRFTSPDRDAIDAVATLYGGPVVQWQNGASKEWEVVTDAAEIPVVLPDNPLGDTPFYEMWSRGGLERRCDGETATCPVRISDDEVDYRTEPCICNARQSAECKVTTRLAVVLPDIPFGGVWRLETHSWNAADELPGMVEAVRAFAARGFVRAFLGIRAEEKMEAGRKKQWIVPYLRLADTVNGVLGGAGQLAALAPAALPSSTAGAAGETVHEEPGLALSSSNSSPPRSPSQKAQLCIAYQQQGYPRCEAVELAREAWGDRPERITDVELARLVEDASIADAELVDEGRPF